MSKKSDEEEKNVRLLRQKWLPSVEVQNEQIKKNGTKKIPDD